VVVWREVRSASTILVDIVCIEAADTGGPESVGITQIWAQSSGCEQTEYKDALLDLQGKRGRE